MLSDKIRTILAHRTRGVIKDSTRIAAAVLVLIYPKDSEEHLLLTKRSNTLAEHRGQVSFPGGVCDPEDDSLQATALREAQEEVGIDGRMVKVLGLLDDCLTTTSNYVITPVLAEMDWSPRFCPNPAEVEEILEIPLAFFLRSTYTHRAAPAGPSVNAPTPVFRFQDYCIWGATARIVEQCADLLTERG